MSDKNKETQDKSFEIQVDTTLTLDQLIGQHKTKEELLSICHQISNKTVYNYWGSNPPKGTMLHGPPGTGKTFAVRCLAAEVDAVLMEVKYEEIASKYVDQQIKILGELSKTVRERSRDKMVILFFEEADMFFPNRGADGVHETDRKRVNFFLRWIDGGIGDQSDNVLFIGATNYLELIDKAILRPGRFEKLLEFKDLEKDDIKEAFKSMYFHQEKKVSHRILEDRALDIDFPSKISGAEVRNIVDETLRLKGRLHAENLGSILYEAVEVNQDSNLSKDEIELFTIEEAQEKMPGFISSSDILEQLKGKAKKNERKRIGFTA